MKRNVAAVSSKYFTWHKETKHLTCEASDLRGFNLSQQIFDDAIDIGFAIRSEKTGKVEIFVNPKINRDREGEIVSWVYSPLDRALYKKGVKVVIFND